MVFIGERCIKIVRIMFMALGLWPYQKSYIWRYQRIFIFIVYCSLISFQLTPWLTQSKCNMDCILKRFSYFCIAMVYVLNYFCLYFNLEAIKQALEHVKLDWRMLGSEDGLKVFEEYLFEAYIFALAGCSFFIVGAFVFIIFETTPIIFDIIIPMNESRPRKLEINFEFFIDEEQYFFLYFTQEVLGVGIGICTIITTIVLIVTILKHCCATYKIASYSMQNTVNIHTLQFPTSQQMQFMYQRVCISVHLHRRTMQFMSTMLNSFTLWYFPLLLICVLSLSCIFFRLYNVIMQFNDFYDILISFTILYCYLIYMFVTNFIAQSYTEHSEGILEATYDTLWYVAPLSIQKLFLIIQKSVKSHKLILGGLFVPSIEGFSALITSAVSYFTFMHAMRS